MRINLKFLLFILVSTIGIVAWGAPLTPQKAIATASDFIISRTPGLKKAPGKTNLQIAYTSTVKEGNCFYIVESDSDKGYVVVSADDRLPSVLGYADTGTFDINSIPPNMKWWLEEYTHEIQSFLRSPEKFKMYVPSSYTPVGPYMKTLWNQNAPYNDLCPIDPTTNARSVTGCVATAMAQVMKYYNYPSKGTGSRGEFSFENVSFDWPNMLNKYVSSADYNSTQANAVATLMVNCGRSVDMEYGSSESGAVSVKVGNALTSYFGYDNSIRYNMRDYCTEQEWEETIYSDLAKGHVVFYHGRTPTGGHAFVCDGYGGNGFYHFNWGWGGSQDGYFRLFILNPASGGIGSYDGGYNSSQGCFTEIQPKQSTPGTPQTLMIMSGYPSPIQSSTYNIWTVKFIKNNGEEGLFYNPTARTESIEFASRFTDINNSSNVVTTTPYSTSLNYNFGFSSVGIIAPTTMTDGTYKVEIVYRGKGESNWIVAKAPNGLPQNMTLVKKGNSMSMVTGELDNVTTLLFNGIQFTHSTVAANGPFCANVTFSNVGTTDYVGSVTYYLTSERENSTSRATRLWSSDFTVNSPCGYSVSTEINGRFGVPAGKYYLYAEAQGKTLLGCPIELNLTDVSTSGRDESVPLVVSEVSPLFNDISVGAPLSFTVTPLSSTTQTGQIVMRIFQKGATSYRLSYTSSSAYTISSARNFRFSAMSLSNLTPGEYEWQIFFSSNSKIVPISDRFPALLYTNKSEKMESGQTVNFRLEGNGANIQGPGMGDYSGNMFITETLGANQVTGIAPATFTFATALESLSLPGTIKSLGAGEFYLASNLKNLEIRSITPPALSEFTFNPESYENITLSVADGGANIFKRTPGWENFHFGQWDIVIDKNCSIVSGMIRDDAGQVYNPYYVSPDEGISFAVETNDGSKPIITYVTSDNETESFSGTDEITLPALNGKTGRIYIGKDVGVGMVDQLDESHIYKNVFTIAGTLVLRDVTLSDINRLPKGIYIADGRKLVVK